MRAFRSVRGFGLGVDTPRNRSPRAALAAAAVGALALALAVPAAAAPGDDGAGATYYLALGDSLSTGYQPDSGIDEPIAYTDLVYERLKADEPGLELVKLGCDGETTDTMIHGGHCDQYQDSSQLDAAVAFLEDHPGEVSYVTDDIGANDVFPCVGADGAEDGGGGSGGSSALPMAGCIADALAGIRANLGTIDARLREAGGDRPAYVGMTYYDPVLAGWPQGGAQQALAAATVPANNVLSAMITSTNAANGWKTADVTAAFDTNDFSGNIDVSGVGTVPTNVSRICAWTWMCAMGDIHANEQGHQKIAAAFLPVLTGESDGAGSPGSAESVGSIMAGPDGSLGSLGSVRGLAGLGAS